MGFRLLLFSVLQCLLLTAFAQTKKPFLQADGPAGIDAKHQGQVTRKNSVLAEGIVDKEPSKNLLSDSLLSNTIPHLVSKLNNTSCADTSFLSLRGFNMGNLFVQSVIQSTDGGVLIPALLYSNQVVSPAQKTYGLLIKINGKGEIAWIQRFEIIQSGYVFFNIMRAVELPGGDIICAGPWNTDGNSSAYNTAIFRLNSNGNIIWKNSIKSQIGMFNSPSGSFTFTLESAINGLNGDVILCGTTHSNMSSGKVLSVVRLNAAGQLVWDANYKNFGFDGSYRFGAFGHSVFLENGQIMAVGLSGGSNNPYKPAAITRLKLDYNTGNLIAKQFFRPEYADVNVGVLKAFAPSWSNKFKRLNNGHYLFYGRVSGNYPGYNSLPKDHFGVVEFDQNFQLVKAYTIASNVINTNFQNDIISFDQSGKGALSLYAQINTSIGVYFARFENMQFQKQRYVLNSSTTFSTIESFAFFPDNSYAAIHNHIETQPQVRNYIGFRKMFDSDTSSCLGKDTALFHFRPLNYIEDPTYLYLDPNEPNRMTQTEITVQQTDTLTTYTQSGCRQISNCDSVNIRGNGVICGNANSLTFTAFKNNGCGSRVQWKIDNTAVDSMRVVNDTTVTIWFKPVNWQGKLYAYLPAGACNTVPIDSMPISIVRTQATLNLGPDTSICTQNQLLLRAGNSFSNYLWQDGSTDSLLTVTTPGLYWVQVSDGCGNSYRDSVQVDARFVSISIGADRTKCNADTLHLNAPSGFLNYTWSNNYNISSTTSQNVVVNPLVDTAYHVRAEKTPGCFAYDTVRITVHNSPPISLGNDTSFCIGGSVTLDAGAGFSSYLWSNNSTSRQIQVAAVGLYHVTGTTAEGCKSYDTLEVKNVWLLPTPSLNKNTELCTGDSKTLNPGSFASYLWQDGSTSATYTVSDVGTYWVEVQDSKGCVNRDSTAITTLLPLPKGFLPQDTAICNYGTLSLQSLRNFNSYTWNTGSLSSAITIDRPGLYWLQVRDNKNCEGRDSIIVNPKTCLVGVFVPTAFTPNKDNKNDVFKAAVLGPIKTYELVVYNRWGQVVFRTKDINKGWDGKVNGVESPSSAFVWVCNYQFEGEKVQQQKGTIMLIR